MSEENAFEMSMHSSAYGLFLYLKSERRKRNV